MPYYQHPWTTRLRGPGYSGFLESRFRRLLSGELKPYELPEFKGMAQTLAKRGALARESAGKQMRRTGLRGPAVATTLRKMEEGQYAPLGQAMQMTYGQLPGMAMRWQQHLDMLGESAADRALRAYLGRKGIGTQEDIANKQMMLQLLGLFI
jgi:hypothetical protein